MLIRSITLISNILSPFFPCKQNGKSAGKASILFAYIWMYFCFHRFYLNLFTLYTLTSVCIFSLLVSIHFQMCWQGEFFQQSWASLVGDNSFILLTFRGDIVRRNNVPVALRGLWVDSSFLKLKTTCVGVKRLVSSPISHIQFPPARLIIFLKGNVAYLQENWIEFIYAK